MVRTCKKCGMEKPLVEFRENKPGYRRYTCNACMDQKAIDWQRENHDRLLAWRKGYYKANRQKQIDQALAWAETNPQGATKHKRTHYHKLKEAAYAAYGGYVCACCGEVEPMFLSIDHVDNDQCEQAKKHGRPHTGLFLVKWLRDNGYPSGFQVLCHNCNQGKRINGGVCPHQVRKA